MLRVTRARDEPIEPVESTPKVRLNENAKGQRKEAEMMVKYFWGHQNYVEAIPYLREALSQGHAQAGPLERLGELHYQLGVALWKLNPLSSEGNFHFHRARECGFLLAPPSTIPTNNPFADLVNDEEETEDAMQDD